MPRAPSTVWNRPEIAPDSPRGAELKRLYGDSGGNRFIPWTTFEHADRTARRLLLRRRLLARQGNAARTDVLPAAPEEEREAPRRLLAQPLPPRLPV